MVIQSSAHHSKDACTSTHAAHSPPFNLRQQPAAATCVTRCSPMKYSTTSAEQLCSHHLLWLQNSSNCNSNCGCSMHPCCCYALAVVIHELKPLQSPTVHMAPVPRPITSAKPAAATAQTAQGSMHAPTPLVARALLSSCLLSVCARTITNWLAMPRLQAIHSSHRKLPRADETQLAT